MAPKISKLSNANCYIDGASFLGAAAEVKLPAVKNKGVEHDALGLIGVMTLPGKLEKMDMSIKWNSFDRDVLRRISNPYKAFPLQVRSSMEQFNADGLESEVPVVAHIQGHFLEVGGAEFKGGDGAQPDSMLAVTYYKLVIDGEDVVEIDLINSIYKVDGEDLLANYRKNLGI